MLLMIMMMIMFAKKGVQFDYDHQDGRDGKSVKDSTDTNFRPKNSTKSAYFATCRNLRQNSAFALCYWN